MNQHYEGMTRLSADLELLQQNEKLEKELSRKGMMLFIMMAMLIATTVINAVNQSKAYDRGWKDGTKRIIEMIKNNQ